MVNRDELKKALDYLRRKDPNNESFQKFDRLMRSHSTLNTAKKPKGSITLFDEWDTKLNSEKMGQYWNKGTVKNSKGERESKGYAKTMEKRSNEFKPLSETYTNAQTKLKDKFGLPNFEGHLTYSDAQRLGKEQRKKDSRGTLERFTDFFKNKDVDGDGERDGLLGLVDRYVVPISRGATDSVIKGNTETMARNNKNKYGEVQNPVIQAAQKDRGVETDILNSIGMVGATLVPYSKAYKGAEFLVNKVPSLAKIANPYTKKAIIGATAGGMAEGGLAATNELANKDAYDLKDHALRTSIGIAGGAILDPAMHGIYNLIKGARGVKPTANQSELLELPEPQLRLQEPQLKLPEPKPLTPNLNTFKQAFQKPNGLQNPIPQLPDNLRIMMNKGKLQQQGLNFVQNTKNIKARHDFSPVETPIDPMNRSQSYWQQRYEDFSKEINNNYDMNKMTPEALEDLWSGFAKYDEPLKLEQVIDLAYPKGFEAPPMPKPLTPEPPLTQALRQDEKINDLIKGLYPPVRPEPDISRSANLNEMVERLQQIAPPKKTENPLEPLQFRRRINIERPINQGLLPKGASKEVAASAEPILSPNVNKEGTLKPVRSSTLQQTEGTADSFRAKVNRQQTKSNKVKDMLSNLRTQFVDDLAPLEKLEKSVRGKLNSAEDSLYKQGRLFRGSTEKANQLVETQLSPILRGVEKAGYSIEDLGDYALAVHAKDVNAKGIKSGFTDLEIQSVLNKYNNPAMEKARQELVSLNNSLLKSLSDSGVISKEALENMQKKHPNYMPLFRSFDDEKIEFASGISKALSVGSSPLKKLEGSSRDVIDPIESIVKNIFRLTNTADRNMVAKQLGALANEDVAGNFVRRLNPGEDAGRKNVISALENGEKVQYEVPPEVFKAMKDMDKEASNFLIKVLQKPASTLRAGATLTPEFSLRNPMRDVAQAFIVSNSGFNPLVDFPVGLFQAAMKGKSIKIAGKEFKAPDKLYRQFLQDNGGLGNIVSVDRDMHQKAIKEALTGNDKRFINIINPKAWLSVLRTIADVSESATKVGEYRAALRSGASRPEAAYRARDIMDFARAGISVREANKVVAFLNANIQGKSKILRAVKENPLKVTMNSIKAVSLPTVGVFMAQQYLASEEQKRLIDDAPNWMKNTFWLIPVPGTEQVARIPKPFDIAPIFANLPERALSYFANNNPEAFDNFARETMSSYTLPVMLTGLAPIIEGMANYSFFREGPIIPQREQDLNYPDQYDINTSETAKAIGKSINTLTNGQGTFKNFGSPRVIDNTIRGLTGGLGTYATDAIDLIVEGSGLVNEVPKPEKDFLTEKTPLRAFLMNKSSTGQSIDKLYNLKDKLSRERGSAKSNSGQYQDEARYKAVNSSSKDVGDISKMIRQIENHPYMDPKEKRKEIDRLNKLRNERAFNTLQQLRNFKN